MNRPSTARPSQRVDIPPDHVLTSATHSHATPRVMRISTAKPDEAYRVLVAGRIAEAVAVAHENLAPATVCFGRFERPEYVACRRLLCEPGSVGVNPFAEAGERVKSVAGTSTKTIRPAGPVDPEVSVLSVRHADGTPLAVLANFSVHYCGGYAAGQVSADYFGAFARELAERLPAKSSHPPFVGLMSNGTSGDTGSIRLGRGKVPAWERIEQSGEALAEATAELVEGLEHHAPQKLTAVTTELELGVRKPTPERPESARAQSRVRTCSWTAAASCKPPPRAVRP